MGGKRFYASAGRYIFDHVDGMTPLLRTSARKRADLHSMRTAVGSALVESEAEQMQIDDILGHAREGTAPRKYSKAGFANGGAAIIVKRLALMCEAMPNVTGRVATHRVVRAVEPLAQQKVVNTRETQFLASHPRLVL